MRIALLAVAAAALPAMAAAQPPAAPAAAAAGDEKISQVIVYGQDPCPAGAADEIVVCARKPESQRYRIPKNLRDDPNDPHSRSWASRASELQYVGRSGIGSCSTSGPGGMIGCFNQIVREARADRATRDEVNWNALIEAARRERLGRIDAKAAAEETEANAPR
ncbi:MAG TPA: hypothetical protein VGD66_06205 [Allosphingosinicella sp.]|jgi:hypothetical protein